MDNKDVKVYLSIDGQMDLVESYVLCTPSKDSIDIFMDADLGEVYMASLATWDQLIHLVSVHADQEIFEFCKEFNIDYDSLMESVRKVRGNG